MAGSKVKKIICNSCGAEFEDTLPECPYCGTMNYKGAEMEYFGRLEEVRSDMEQLGSVPEQETRSELKKQRKWILKLVLFLAVAAVLLFLGMKWREFRYSDQRDSKADYAWQKENFPILDQLYKEENYDKLLDAYVEAVKENKPIDLWEHYDFCLKMVYCRDTLELLEREKGGETLSKNDEICLLDNYWILKGIPYGADLTKDEEERLDDSVKEVLGCLEGRWNFPEETRKEFERQIRNQNGYPDYDYCEEYIKQWMKGGKQHEM